MPPLMNTKKIRIIGATLAALGIVIFPALALANVPLLTRSSAYFADTGITNTSVHLHWPIMIPAILLVAGLVLMFLPRRA